MEWEKGIEYGITRCYTLRSIGGDMSQIKTAISIDAGIFRVIDSLARKARISRSRFFEMAVRDWVKKEQQKDLTARINRAMEKRPSSAEHSKLPHEMIRHQRKLMEGEW